MWQHALCVGPISGNRWELCENFDVQNKNLLQLAVPNAATPNFTAAKQAAA